MINVLIADDHPLFRRGLAAYFDEMDGYRIAMQASNGEEVIEGLRSIDVDLVMLDINLPSYNGFELLSLINNDYKDVHVVVLTMHDEIAYANRAFDLGASAYLVKDDAEEQLDTCLRSVR